MKKFKEGDKIVVKEDIKAFGGSVIINKGVKGYIKGVCPVYRNYDYEVLFDNNNQWLVHEQEINLVEEAEKPSGKIKSDKPKLLILGKKSSGKDTFCEILKANYGYTFESSSKRIIEEFFPLIQEVYEWKSVEDAYEFRDEMRPFLYQLIKGYNGRDNTRMARLILQDSDIYCGMRDSAEVEACLQAELFDLVIWVDAEKRLGDTEGAESCNVTKGLADIIIENNKDEWEFTQKVKALMEVIER